MSEEKIESQNLRFFFEMLIFLQPFERIVDWLPFTARPLTKIIQTCPSRLDLR